MKRHDFRHTTTMHDLVVEELQARRGVLNKIAEETGMSYDTVLRIRNREGDPAVSKIETLYRYLFAKKRRR
jgi:hypothetical protein